MHYIYLDILFSLRKVIPIMFERVTTYNRTLQIWIDHNVTRYHNFKALPHPLPYIFLQFSMVWYYLQCVIMCYNQIY